MLNILLINNDINNDGRKYGIFFCETQCKRLQKLQNRAARIDMSNDIDHCIVSLSSEAIKMMRKKTKTKNDV